MIHNHNSIRSSVRIKTLTSSRNLAELSVARCIARTFILDLSEQMLRSMALDTSINRRVRNSKYTTALIWSVTYLDCVEEDDLPTKASEAKVVADVIVNYMESHNENLRNNVVGKSVGDN